MGESGGIGPIGVTDIKDGAKCRVRARIGKRRPIGLSNIFDRSAIQSRVAGPAASPCSGAFRRPK